MWIVKLEANPNGSHNDHRADHIATVPEGWAMIPDDFTVPSTFPFVGIEAEDVTFYREVEVEKEVTKTREVETLDMEGNAITITEEYTEMETVTEERPYTMHTVTAMTEGEVPVVEEEEAEPTTEERVTALEEQYAAIEDALCEMDATNAASIAAIEDALCEMDKEG